VRDALQGPAQRRQVTSVGGTETHAAHQPLHVVEAIEEVAQVGAEERPSPLSHLPPQDWGGLRGGGEKGGLGGGMGAQFLHRVRAGLDASQVQEGLLGPAAQEPGSHRRDGPVKHPQEAALHSPVPQRAGQFQVAAGDRVQADGGLGVAGRQVP